MNIILVSFYSLEHQLCSDTKHVTVIISKKKVNKNIAVNFC